MLAIADAESLDRFHLAGHSMGGVIAQQVALSRQAARRQPGAPVHVPQRAAGHHDRADDAAVGDPIACRHPPDATAGVRRAGDADVIPRRAWTGTVCARSSARCSAATSPTSPRSSCGNSGRWGASTPRRASRSLAGLPTLVVSGAQDRIARPAYGRALAAGDPGRTVRRVGRRWPRASRSSVAAEVNALLDELFRARSPSATG